MAKKKATTEGAENASRAKTTRSKDATSEASVGRTEARPRTITYDMISRRAYELYVARGRADGFAEQDWAQAERELRGQM